MQDAVAAYFFIDALNPDGSLEQNFYQRIKKINQELLPFKEMIAHHRPELCAEVGVYFAIESCVNLLNNGVKTKNLKEVCNNMAQRSNPVVEELLGITALVFFYSWKAELKNSLYRPKEIRQTKWELFFR